MIFLLFYCFPTLTSKCPKGRFVALWFICEVLLTLVWKATEIEKEFNSLSTNAVWRLLITFLTNSLDPDQAQTVLHSDDIPERIFFKKLILKKNQQTTKKHEKLPSMQ